MKVVPKGPKFGVDIYDIDLNHENHEETYLQIRDFVAQKELVVIKNQDVLSPERLIEVAGYIGQPMAHPFISTDEPLIHGISPYQPFKEFPEINGIYNDTDHPGNLNEWHSDLNWLKHPSYGSILQCVTKPTLGGDTVWASMTCIYEDLDKELLDTIKDERAYHDCMNIYAGLFDSTSGEDIRIMQMFPKVAHPIVFPHPLTGKNTVFANKVSCKEIKGFDISDSETTLKKIFAYIDRPEYQVRHSWEEGDIAIWDNISTQHYAISDYWPESRKMHRVSLAGIEIK